jgi:hypothetical protein
MPVESPARMVNQNGISTHLHNIHRRHCWCQTYSLFLSRSKTWGPVSLHLRFSSLRTENGRINVRRMYNVFKVNIGLIPVSIVHFASGTCTPGWAVAKRLTQSLTPTADSTLEPPDRLSETRATTPPRLLNEIDLVTLINSDLCEVVNTGVIMANVITSHSALIDHVCDTTVDNCGFIYTYMILRQQLITEKSITFNDCHKSYTCMNTIEPPRSDIPGRCNHLNKNIK